MLSLATSLTYDIELSDSRRELLLAQEAINNGWNPFELSMQSNVSIVIGVIIPAIAKTIKQSPEFVHRMIFPFIFSLTPVFLYLIYRKFLVEKLALMAALFFATFPPTYKSIPCNCKSSIAEPIAAGALLVYFSELDNKYRLPLLAILILITAMAHYTIGFLLLGLIGIVSVINSFRTKVYDKTINVTLIVSGLVYIYYSIVNEGYILRMIRGWLSSEYIPQSDLPFQVTTGANFFSMPIISKVFYLSHYSIMGLMVIGLIYFLSKIKVMKIDSRYSYSIIICSIVLITVLIFPRLRIGLYFDRWAQITAGILSPTIVWASNVVPIRVIVGAIVIYFVFTCGFVATHIPGDSFLPTTNWDCWGYWGWQ